MTSPDKPTKRKCAECREVFQPRRHCDVFCSTKCRKAEHNREMTRGKAIYRAVFWWRKHRGSGPGKGLFAEVCRIADEWAAEDRERGYPAPPLHQRRDSRFISRRGTTQEETTTP